MSNAENPNDDRRSELDKFAEAPPRQAVSAPIMDLPSAGDRVFGAQRVAVYRSERSVLEKLKLNAAAAGEDWYYRWPVRGDGGGTEYVEGPSIKLADDLARIFGNCDVDTRVIDLGDSWLFYARFIDLETGYSRTRPYQQRKGQRTSKKMDADRSRDIAFQIGTSKAERNVIVHSLRTFADYAYNEARNSLVEKIGKDLKAWIDRTTKGLAREEVPLVNVEHAIGRAVKDWTAPDVAKIIAMMKAIGDGMATQEETFPAPDKVAKVETAKPDDKKPETQAKAETAKADDKPKAETVKQNAASDKAPKNADEYEAHVLAYVEAVNDPDGLWKDHWLAEKNMRNALNVTPEKRDELKAKVEAKVAKLRQSE